MIAAVKGVNAGLSFLLELAVLAAVGYRAYTLGQTPAVRWGLAVAVVVIWAVVWGLFGAPKAAFPQHGLGRVVLEGLWFGSAPVALIWAGRQTLATVFIALYVINTALRVVWNQV